MRLILIAVLLGGCAFADVLPVVRSVAELAAELCDDDDDSLACLRKCEAEQARRSCDCGMLTDDPLPARCAPCEGAVEPE